MTSAIAPHSPAKPAGGAHQQWVRFVLPLLALSLLIGAIGAVGYRYLSDEIRRETHRTLAVIAEQKRQHVEDWLAETRIDAELYFSGHSQLEALFGQWLDGGRRDGAILEQMQARMGEVARVRGWAGLAVLDDKGHPAFVVGEADMQEHAALVQEILRRPRIELVDLYRNARGETHYGVIAPIGPAGSPPLGVGLPDLEGRPDLAPTGRIVAGADPDCRNLSGPARRRRRPLSDPTASPPQRRTHADPASEHASPARRQSSSGRARHPRREAATTVTFPCWPTPPRSPARPG